MDAEGRSWRSGALVEKKLMKQWYLKITEFTKDLLSDLDTLDEWPQHVVKMQKEWIGESTGTMISFKVVPSESESDSEDQVLIDVPLVYINVLDYYPYSSIYF